MKESRGSGTERDAAGSRGRAVWAVLKRVAAVVFIIVAACVANSPAEDEPVLSQRYPYAAATPDELEYLSRLYDACVSCDIPALEELSTVEEKAEDVYNKVMVPFSRQLSQEYGESGTHFFEDGVEYFSLEFDGVNAGYRLEARGREPIVNVKFSFDGASGRVWKLSFECKRNGFKRSLFVTKEYSEYGLRIMSSLYKDDSLPVGEDGAAVPTLLTRDSIPVSGGQDIIEAVFTGEFDFSNGIRVLKTGMADFRCYLQSGESYSGGAQVEDFKTVSVDKNITVTVETAENGVTVHTMWLPCGKLWTAFRTPCPVPEAGFENSPGYKQFPFVIWPVFPSAYISPDIGQIIEIP